MLSACLLLVFIKNCTIFIYLSFDSRSQFPRRGGEENRTKRKSEPFLIERKLSIPFRFSRSLFHSFHFPSIPRLENTSDNLVRCAIVREKVARARSLIRSTTRFISSFSLFFLNRAEEAPLPPASRPQEDLPSQEPRRG